MQWLVTGCAVFGGGATGVISRVGWHTLLLARTHRTSATCQQRLWWQWACVAERVVYCASCALASFPWARRGQAKHLIARGRVAVLVPLTPS